MLDEEQLLSWISDTKNYYTDSKIVAYGKKVVDGLKIYNNNTDAVISIETSSMNINADICLYRVKIKLNLQMILDISTDTSVQDLVSEQMPTLCDSFERLFRNISKSVPLIFNEGKICEVGFLAEVEMLDETVADDYMKRLGFGNFENIFDCILIKTKRKTQKRCLIDVDLGARKDEMSFGVYKKNEDESMDKSKIVCMEIESFSFVFSDYSERTNTELINDGITYVYNRLFDYFSLIYGSGNFISKKEAIERIEKSDYDETTQRMIKEIVKVTYKQKDLMAAFVRLQMDESMISEYMKYFNDLGFSPIVHAFDGQVLFNPLRIFTMDSNV